MNEILWPLSFLGRLHPLVVHFPIGFLFAALLLEVMDWRRKSAAFRPAIHFLLVTGSMGAGLAVVFGLLLAWSEGGEGELLSWHRLLGIITFVLILLTWFFFSRENYRKIYRGLLFASVVAISWAGHYGALLTHGETYLSEVLPTGEGSGVSPVGEQVAFVRNEGELTAAEVQDLNIKVRTVLAHSCYNCHGEAKSKGGLRLDSREAIFKGGESGLVISPGKPDKSELIRRVKLPAGHKEVMPSKGRTLNKEEIALLTYWIEKGAPWPDKEKSIYRLASLAPRKPEVPPQSGDLVNPVDRFVNVYFKEKGVSWPAVIDDRLYLKRVSLDITGLLPSAEDIETFVNDTRPDKREQTVRKLLGRNHDYAQHWLSFWNDALRNDYTGTGYITRGRFDITKWLYSSLATNKPYNWFVKELISPSKDSEGFIKGIKWRGTINASQRTEMQAAQNVAQVFLGLNLKCASCHDSFISDWKLEDAYAFANVFADSTLEISRCDKPTGRMAGTKLIFPELGQITENASTERKLKELADFLIQPEDGRLYRTLVNRIWAQLMGRGIIEPVDEMDNLPWSEDLLDWLASDFAEGHYDVKELIYKIVTSKTYRLSSVSLKEAGDLTAQHFQFKGMVRRRLTAEQFADAVSQVFTPVYADSAMMHSLFPADIQANIPFVRASLVKNDRFLTAMGRPGRETVTTGRTSQANLLQAMELTNGSKFSDVLVKGATEWQAKFKSWDQLTTVLFRRAYGRRPSASEMAMVRKWYGNGPPGREAIEDLVWAVVLSPEFQLIY